MSMWSGPELAQWSQQYYPDLVDDLRRETGIDPELVNSGLLVFDEDEQQVIGVVVDLEWRALWERRMTDPLADAETLRTDGQGRLLEIGRRPRSYDEIEAQYLGLIRLSPAGCDTLRAALERAAATDGPVFGGPRTLDQAYFTDLLDGLIVDGVVVKTIPIRGGWTEVDSHEDLRVATSIVREQRWTHPSAAKVTA